MNLQTYLRIKEAATGAAPMPGPTQYIPKNTTTPKSSSTPKNVGSSSNNTVKQILELGIGNGCFNNRLIPPRSMNRTRLAGLALTGAVSGGYLGASAYRPRLRSVNPYTPRTPHSEVLLKKLERLEPLNRKATSKRQKIRNERKRENALNYLEDTDRQAYLKYMFGPDYFNQ